MTIYATPEALNEFRLHECIIVRYVEADDPGALEVFSKALRQPASVALFHDEHNVRPFKYFGRARVREAKQFFFEKKNQKTFALSGEPVRTSVLKNSKVFCFFFSKKKRFFFALRGSAPTRRASRRSSPAAP